MKEKESKARVAVCILLIAWNPSGESETLPSDQPPASLTLLQEDERQGTSYLLGTHYYSMYRFVIIYSISFR